MSRSSPQEWPADRVERRPIASLIPYARNAREHDDANVAKLAASIREFGWTIPVLIDEEGTLIAGHGRVLAAQRLGIVEIPTMVALGWTEAQVKAYRLADNRLTLDSRWSDDSLKIELGELQAIGFDIGLTGFGEEELAGLLAEPDDRQAEGEGHTKEIDPDEFSMGCKCPRCGFEFDA